MLSARALPADDSSKDSCLSKKPKTYTYNEINDKIKEQNFESVDQVIVIFETIDSRKKALEKFSKVIKKTKN